MPNHVYQKLTVDKNLDKIVDLVGEDFDIDKFFPMPEELRHVSSPVRIIPEEKIGEEKAKYEAMLELSNNLITGMGITQKYSDELKSKYGYDNWYDWANANYGTKWGIYEVNKDGDQYYFQSAWSPATKIIEKLSLSFPDTNFELMFADEGGGFIGKEIIKDGHVIECTDYDWESENANSIKEELGILSEEEDEE